VGSNPISSTKIQKWSQAAHLWSSAFLSSTVLPHVFSSASQFLFRSPSQRNHGRPHRSRGPGIPDLTQQDCRSVGRWANAKTSTSSRQLDQEKVESFEVFTRHSQRTCRRAVTYFVCGCSTYQSTSTTPGVAGRLSLLLRIEMPKNRFLRSPCATRAILLTSRNVAGAPEIAIHICDPISH
jgi:hypothetical protein